MRVAPFESCLVCLRGDVDTAFGLRGSAEFSIAFLIAKLEMQDDEATQCMAVYYEQEFGCDPGMVPDGLVEVAIRLCRRCAAKKGIAVSSVATSTGLRTYSSPDDSA